MAVNCIPFLPIFGALGGMIVPAGVLLLLNYGTSTQSGARYVIKSF